MFGSLCRAVMTGIVTLVLISACSSSSNTYRPQPTVTQGTEPVSLLFAHVSTCPHCRYEMPIIAEFEKKYPWVTVIHKNYFDLRACIETFVARMQADRPESGVFPDFAALHPGYNLLESEA